jgi:hypothetical protein
VGITRPNLIQTQDVVVPLCRLHEHIAQPQHVAIDAAHGTDKLVRPRLEARSGCGGDVEGRAGDRVGRHAPVDVEVQAGLVAEVLVGAGELGALRSGGSATGDFDIEAFLYSAEVPE